MQGPLAQWPKPAILDMPSRHEVMWATALPPESAATAMARQHAVAFLCVLMHPVAFRITRMEIVLVIALDGVRLRSRRPPSLREQHGAHGWRS